MNEITDDDLRKIANCAVPTVAEVCALAQAERSRREAVPVVCLDCGKTHEGNCCNTSEAKSDVYPYKCSKCGMELQFGDYDIDGATPDYVRTCWKCVAIEKHTPPAKVTEPDSLSSKCRKCDEYDKCFDGCSQKCKKPAPVEPWKPVAIIDEATVRNAILQLQKRVEALEGRAK